MSEEEFVEAIFQRDLKIKKLNEKIKKDYVSKDKIKAKIKELEEKSKDSDNNVFLYGIYFYKELLKEGE